MSAFGITSSGYLLAAELATASKARQVPRGQLDPEANPVQKVRRDRRGMMERKAHRARLARKA